MKSTQFFVSTLKEAPADAEVVSHKLMMRAGLIKRLGAGIYSYMPMGLRVIRKVEQIIREEMNRAGAVELLMPVVQPAELWQETGRFDKMGPELLRVKDRHERDFIIQPTSEEVIAAAPDIIIGSWCGKHFRPERVAARTGWDAIPAVNTGKMHEIKSAIILTPGPVAISEGLPLLLDIFDL